MEGESEVPYYYNNATGETVWQEPDDLTSIRLASREIQIETTGAFWSALIEPGDIIMDVLVAVKLSENDFYPVHRVALHCLTFPDGFVRNDHDYCCRAALHGRFRAAAVARALPRNGGLHHCHVDAQSRPTALLVSRGFNKPYFSMPVADVNKERLRFESLGMVNLFLEDIPQFIIAASLPGDDLNENEKFIMILQVVSTIVFIFYKAAFTGLATAIGYCTRDEGQSAWDEEEDAHGRVFFRHRKTRRATWTPPRLHVEMTNRNSMMEKKALMGIEMVCKTELLQRKRDH